MPENPLDMVKDAVEIADKAFDLGFKAGNAHNEAADAHHLDVINDNAVREQVLAQEAVEFEPPDVGDFG